MNVFDLVASLRLDSSEYEEGMGKAQSTLGKFGSAAASGLATAAKATAAMTTAAAGATATLTKSAVEGYAEYQQLVGGVDKLFGEASVKVQQYAEDAYKTSGLSANEYMEQATSFSAALINSLGGDTAKAADMTDVAMKAIADNVNTFGSDIGSVQNAFQGFAKQNYTMLDNLKLGYGGTKEEMERLIADANTYAASIGEASNLSTGSFADIIQAIELIQQKQGIAGATAKEASTTISGSLGMVSSSWKNLVVGIANGNANMSKLINNFVSSIKSAAGNLLPQISQALDGVGELVTGLAPVIVDAIPVVVNEVLPSLLESGATLITTLLEGLSSQSDQVANGAVMIITLLITTISENLPLIIEAAISIITNLANGLAEQIPQLVPVILDAIILIVNTLIQNAPQLLKAALTLIMALAKGLIDYLPKLIEQLPTIIQNIVDSLTGMSGDILSAGITLLLALAKGLIQAIPQLILQLPQIITSVVGGLLEGVAQMADVGLQLIQGLWNGISNAKDWILDKIKGFGSSILGGIKDFFGIASPSKEMAKIGDFMAQGLAKGWDDNVGEVIDEMNDDMNLEGNATMNVSAGKVSGFETTEAQSTTDAMLAQIHAIFDAQIERLINAITNLNPSIVLDTGILVGEIAQDMDRQLGIEAGRNSR